MSARFAAPDEIRKTATRKAVWPTTPGAGDPALVCRRRSPHFHYTLQLTLTKVMAISNFPYVDPGGPWLLLQRQHPDRYKWIALSNTTIGILMATINGSILLIALPNIFRGITAQPARASNTPYFLWILMGFLLVTSVLVVSFGRVGDMFGRVRMYTLGFAIFTVFSILLAVTWMTGPAAAMWIIVMRVGQGVGGAFLFANSNAIITDAFPAERARLRAGHQRRRRDRRLVPRTAARRGARADRVAPGVPGLGAVRPVRHRVGVLQAARQRRGARRPAIDWLGNFTFAMGLDRVAHRHRLRSPALRRSRMGWTSPFVLSCIIGGWRSSSAFVLIELTGRRTRCSS